MIDTSQITNRLLDELAERVAERVLDRLSSLAGSRAVADELLDEPKMAERLNVSQQTLQRMRKAGAVPSVRIGRRVLYRQADVLDALSSSKKQNGGDA